LGLPAPAGLTCRGLASPLGAAGTMLAPLPRRSWQKVGEANARCEAAAGSQAPAFWIDVCSQNYHLPTYI